MPANKQVPALNLPIGWQTAALSQDIEDRRGNQGIVAPAPSLLDQINASLNTLGTKIQMFNTGLHHNWNPYWQPPVDPNFYRPGYDASTTPLTPQQAAIIRAQANQRFSNGR